MELTDNEMTLVTLGFGAFLSLGSARFQHWRDRVANKHDREETRRNALEDERRQREADAAKSLLKVQAEIRTVLRRNSFDVRPDELLPLTEEIDILAAYIDNDALRERVEYLGGFIAWCEEVGSRVDEDPRDVAWKATNEVGWNASCLLRGKVHPEPDWHPAWAAAWDAAEADVVQQQARSLAASGEQRAEEGNPDNYR